jgi:VanZ family protein
MAMLFTADTQPRMAFRILLLGWMGLIFFLSSRSQLPSLRGMSPELESIAGHFTVYAVLAILLWVVLPSERWSDRRRIVLAFVGAVAYGVSDEWHQSFVAGRDPALFDLAVDTVAAACALIALNVVLRIRERRLAPHP